MPGARDEWAQKEQEAKALVLDAVKEHVRLIIKLSRDHSLTGDSEPHAAISNTPDAVGPSPEPTADAILAPSHREFLPTPPTRLRKDLKRSKSAQPSRGPPPIPTSEHATPSSAAMNVTVSANVDAADLARRFKDSMSNNLALSKQAAVNANSALGEEKRAANGNESESNNDKGVDGSNEIPLASVGENSDANVVDRVENNLADDGETEAPSPANLVQVDALSNDVVEGANLSDCVNVAVEGIEGSDPENNIVETEIPESAVLSSGSPVENINIADVAKPSEDVGESVPDAVQDVLEVDAASEFVSNPTTALEESAPDAMAAIATPPEVITEARSPDAVPDMMSDKEVSEILREAMGKNELQKGEQQSVEASKPGAGKAESGSEATEPTGDKLNSDKGSCWFVVFCFIVNFFLVFSCFFLFFFSFNVYLFYFLFN
jgi:hypothetical protein